MICFCGKSLRSGVIGCGQRECERRRLLHSIDPTVDPEDETRNPVDLDGLPREAWDATMYCDSFGDCADGLGDVVLQAYAAGFAVGLGLVGWATAIATEHQGEEQEKKT